eukprot:TRINITY_DN29180_c0_g1_i1.p1 TRINITY_DN29180_c0_g1~~TRINITY_DN29180_c0_g1_i1.p1  ORF type:complete len:232 (+),score=20.57 TRINITY_DN29180_c0_g1_i1:322-1017(+)
MVPFGNAYYVTNESICGGAENVSSYVWAYTKKQRVWWTGYTKSVRNCWDAKCGRGTSQPEACYQDGPYCQHGEAECVVNALQACAKNVTKSYVDYVPFAACMHDKYDVVREAVPDVHDWRHESEIPAITAAVTKCSDSTGLDADDILECYWERRGKVHLQQAKATPVHPSVPYVTIVNKTGVETVVNLPDDMSEDPTFLLRLVCSAWQFNGGSNSVTACSSLEDASKEMLV